MLEADLAKAKALREAVAGADSAQEKKKESRKSSTAKRTAAGKRIEKAVDTIVSAGLICDFDKPDIRARFEALVPGRGRKAKPENKPT